jgi:hypothetical protein
LHPDIHIIKPNYYVLPGWRKAVEPAAYVQVLQDAAEAMPYTTALLEAGIRKHLEELDLFRDRVYYYHGALRSHEIRRIDLANPTLGVESVTTMAISSAIYMGFSEIYLLGVDHDVLLRILLGQRPEHFYEERMGHYSPNVSADLGAWLQSSAKIWAQHKVLRTLALKQGTHIYNATEGSFLDVYPRVNLIDVL